MGHPSERRQDRLNLRLLIAVRLQNEGHLRKEGCWQIARKWMPDGAILQVIVLKDPLFCSLIVLLSSSKTGASSGRGWVQQQQVSRNMSPPQPRRPSPASNQRSRSPTEYRSPPLRHRSRSRSPSPEPRKRRTPPNVVDNDATSAIVAAPASAAAASAPAPVGGGGEGVSSEMKQHMRDKMCEHFADCQDRQCKKLHIDEVAQMVEVFSKFMPLLNK